MTAMGSLGFNLGPERATSAVKADRRGFAELERPSWEQRRPALSSLASPKLQDRACPRRRIERRHRTPHDLVADITRTRDSSPEWKRAEARRGLRSANRVDTFRVTWPPLVGSVANGAKVGALVPPTGMQAYRVLEGLGETRGVFNEDRTRLTNFRTLACPCELRPDLCARGNSEPPDPYAFRQCLRRRFRARP